MGGACHKLFGWVVSVMSLGGSAEQIGLGCSLFFFPPLSKLRGGINEEQFKAKLVEQEVEKIENR